MVRERERREKAREKGVRTCRGFTNAPRGKFLPLFILLFMKGRKGGTETEVMWG